MSTATPAGFLVGSRMGAVSVSFVPATSYVWIFCSPPPLA
jgi:hypothetical protein